ncbi:MAG TPA: primosomal protein N' (replication factor Y) - superfamily II helicase [Planctomycetota bacterium]|nr:primosomal protein N' (replication factor Y) - superfamily II helicase [Planctomycetota bacterium]
MSEAEIETTAPAEPPSAPPPEEGTERSYSRGRADKERKFPCHKCGADLNFTPGQEVLKCPYCGYEEHIPQTEAEIKEYSFNDYLAKPKQKGYGGVPGQRREVRCQGCGGTTTFDASVRSTKCPFCASPLVLDDGNEVHDEDVIAPEALIPFVITEQQADSAFRKWIKSLWFAPNALKNEHSIARKIQGVYRPFWTYDAHTVSHWTGERGDAYYVTQTYTTVVNGKTVTRTRQVRKIRWTYVSGIYREFFDDVLIRAGKNTDKPTRYHLKDLKPYSPDYLSGFGAERYQVSLNDGWHSAKEVIAEGIRSGVRSQIGGDEQRIHTVNTAYSGVTYKHILLPLWLSCYHYASKLYCFQVNGQTGEVAGDRPYSFWKIFFFVLFILGLIAIGFALANQH